MNDREPEYVVQCFSCLGEFDAMQAVWCSHDPHNPTKICPYCLTCFCGVPTEFTQRFWDNAPESLRREHEALRDTKYPIGNLMVQAGIVTMEQILQAVAAQSKNPKERLGEVLLRMQAVTQEELDYFLRIQAYKAPHPLKPEHADLMVLKKLTPLFCHAHRVFPLVLDDVGNRQYIRIACTDRSQTELMEEIRDKLLAHPIPFLVDEKELLAALKPYLRYEPKKTEKPFDPKGWISQLIAGALVRGASDIHIDPMTSELLIRIRIDGVLYKWQSLPKRHFDGVLDRIVRFFKMEEPVGNTPVQASVQIKVKSKRYKLQCMILPAQYAASISIKVINLTTFLKDLSDLGLTAAQEAVVKMTLTSPNGLVIVSGPPMQGTITTEYAMLSYLQRFDRKIISIETPVYYTMPEIQQLDVDPIHGRDIRTTLDQVAQQSPDVTYIASVPGPEVLGPVLDHAARSLVIVDFNAMSTWETLQWMIEHGVSTTQLAVRLKFILNQRLVRRICSHCRHESSMQRGLMIRMGLEPEEADRVQPFEGAGCDQCNYLGYRGRVALFELLTWSEDLARGLQSGMSLRELKATAVGLGFKSLRRICIEKIRAGETTIDEMQRWNIREA